MEKVKPNSRTNNSDPNCAKREAKSIAAAKTFPPKCHPPPPPQQQRQVPPHHLSSLTPPRIPQPLLPTQPLAITTPPPLPALARLPTKPKQYSPLQRPPPSLASPPPAAQAGAPPSPTTPPTPGELVSIQIPMAGPGGQQTMHTINVPRSVLAGASDRPILLTVTPKNGVNKGQKQIVVLTKNQPQDKGAPAPNKGPTINMSNYTLSQALVQVALFCLC